MADGTLDALRNGELTQEQEQHGSAGALVSSRVRKKDSHSDRLADSTFERDKVRRSKDAAPSHPTESDKESDGGFFE
jgi:hypothetical protein